jgi:Flp pilus assembly protein CpaB
MMAAIFAILIGLAGAYSVRQYLKQAPEEVAEEADEAAPDMVLVPTAARDLIAGKSLTINDIVLHRLTREEFRKSEFFGQSFMPDPQQIVGRTLRNPLSKKGLFQPTDFYSDGEGPGVAELLKRGMRAVTVSIKNIGAVEGFARPGSWVDILYRADARDETPEVTMTLLQNVEVLAVGKTAVPGQTVRVGNGQQNQDGSITLAVTLYQAKALKVVEGHGELTLALRHPEEVGGVLPVTRRTAGDEKITLERLVGLKPVRRKRELEIYRGGHKQTITFETIDRSQTPSRFGGLIDTPIAANPGSREAGRDGGGETTLNFDTRIENSASDVVTPATVAGKDGGGS